MVFVILGSMIFTGAVGMVINDYVAEQRCIDSVNALNEIEERKFKEAQEQGKVYLKTKWTADI